MRAPRTFLAADPIRAILLVADTTAQIATAFVIIGSSARWARQAFAAIAVKAVATNSTVALVCIRLLAHFAQHAIAACTVRPAASSAALARRPIPAEVAVSAGLALALGKALSVIRGRLLARRTLVAA